jgi:hypothetical protein
MDPIALASVLSSGTVGLAGVAATWWNARRPVQVAREQRKADGYLEVLQIMEQEALWLANVEYNSKLDDHDLEMGIVGVISNPRPERSAHARAAALLGARGTKKAQDAYRSWRSVIDEAERFVEGLSFDASENYPHGPSDNLVTRFSEHIRPREIRARDHFTMIVKSELSH